MSDMNQLREAIQVEFQMAVVEKERYAAEVKSIEEQLRTIRTMEGRCKERVARLEKVLAMLGRTDGAAG